MIGLIFANIIWSLNPVFGKIALEDLAPLEVAWFRYASALIGLALLRPLFKNKGSWVETTRRRPIFLIGLLTFCLSPLLTNLGLQKTQAVDSALIIAIEPLITVALAAIFLGERLTRSHTILFFFSLLGFSWLSDLSPERLKTGLAMHTVGNLILLTSLVGEGAYSILGKPLLKTLQPVKIFFTGLLWGVGLLTIALLFFHGAPRFSQLTFKSIGAILWLGPFSTSCGYLYWLYVMRRVKLVSVALTLFVQPLAGAIFATQIRGESLSVKQLAGGAVILVSVLLQVFIDARYGQQKPLESTEKS